MFYIGNTIIMQATLFLIQSSAIASLATIEKLKSIYQEHDQVVFLGESILALSEELVKELTHCYILKSEMSFLNPELKNFIKYLDYDEFSDLVLQFERCVSFK
ncbi:sulfur transfer complex TusBCD TusB component (DsrH family) [Acinetobacter baylyi]|nr:sulfur transfer complex TusBCD TusB component (DsrH family) [Acinetobacter baylyi]